MEMPAPPASICRRGKICWLQHRAAARNVQRSLRTISDQIARRKKKQIEGLEAPGQVDLPGKTPIRPFAQSFCAFLKQCCTERDQAEGSPIR